MEPSFHAEDGVGKVAVKLEQIEPIPLRRGSGRYESEYFRLIEGFSYRNESHLFVVTPQTLEKTDLASVPFLFRWFASPGGRHTLPSLLHDCLIHIDCARSVTRSGAVPTRPEADDIFKEALGVCGVPTIRRHIMWSAVASATRWEFRGWSRPGIVLWAILALIGTVAVLFSWIATFFGMTPWLFGLIMPVAAAGPFIFQFLWGTQRGAARWFGFAILLLILPTAFVFLTYLVYRWVLEYGLRFLRNTWRWVSRSPEAGEYLPEPPGIRHI